MNTTALEQMHYCVSRIISVCELQKGKYSVELLNSLLSAYQTTLKELIPSYPSARDVCTRYCDIASVVSVDPMLLKHKYTKDVQKAARDDVIAALSASGSL